MLNCWAIHNDESGASRPLTEEEKELIKKEFPDIVKEDLLTIFTDVVESIAGKP
jgi:hypothetical protein